MPQIPVADSVFLYKKAAPFAKVDTLTQVDKCIKENAATYGLTTTKRIAAFMAQAAHESSSFTRFREIWDGKGWQATYGNKMGNNGAADGYKFRGRGAFQTTGHDNYKATSLAIFGDTRLLDQPEILEQPYYAALSAMYFWNNRGFNKLADEGNFREITRRLNGAIVSTTHLPERVAFWNAFTAVMAISPGSFVVEAVKKKSNNVQSTVVTSYRNLSDYFGFFLFGK
jgi:putative chitinase